MKQQNTSNSKKVIGYTWVSAAHSWQVYQHFNSSATDKIEWVNSEDEAKKRVEELKGG